MNKRPYRHHRMWLIFVKGPLFYAEFNIRLFLYLLLHKADLIVANDLDTLPAAFLASKFKRCNLVYDSHEYYTETPELVNRKTVQNIWSFIEGLIFPKLHDIITVNDSIARLYEKKYKKKIHVVRNIPPSAHQPAPLTRKQLNLPENRPIILLQGAGINIQRGAEEAIEAMQYVNNALFIIIGGGDVIELLKATVQHMKLTDKVQFIPKQPMERLFQYTQHATLGLTLDKDTNINYRYSLPNKLFDYIHAGVPILASPLPEIKNIITTYNVGTFIDNHNPHHIADRINEILANEEQLLIWKKNTSLAAKELNWDIEEKHLINLYKKYL